MPPHLKLAYLPHYGNVRLRLTGTGDDRNKLEKELDEQSKTLRPLIQEWLVIDDDMTIQQVVAKLLKERKQTVGTAESCTGGYIAHLLTIDPGASSNFKGTVVAYDNQVKEDILGVSHDTIESAGAVSEETVRQMVQGTLKQLKTDYALATLWVSWDLMAVVNKSLWALYGSALEIIKKLRLNCFISVLTDCVILNKHHIRH